MSKENERLYDLRILERNIRKGLIARKDVEKYLKSLPDRADNAQAMVAEEEDHHDAEGGNNVSEG